MYVINNKKNTDPRVINTILQCNFQHVNFSKQEYITLILLDPYICKAYAPRKQIIRTYTKQLTN